MADPTILPAILDRIVDDLRALRREAPDRLQPPLTVEEVRAWETRFPFVFSTEMEIIYGWHNGTRAEEGALLESLYFFPGFYFVSMEEAFQIYSQRADAPQWRHGWFPLFADGAGDFYIVPCTSERRTQTEIIGFIHGEPIQVVEYESLTAMAQTIDACFREEAFFLDENDTMEIDDGRHHEIAHRFNPTIPEWQS